ncbi:MAG: CAAX amino terminal protease self- immunity [Firmicutes bacterium ADurb.Bin193]|nr:MAG: CAAX amino terminal protease self- immunity [Firmicutes bacterium ADurb.Bin193]
MKKKHIIMTIVIISCIIMGLLDAVVQPNYIIKSAVKIPLFLILPLIYCKIYKDKNLLNVLVPSKKGFLRAFSVGVSVFAAIMAAYYLLKDVFDFSNVTTVLTSDIGVTAGNFVWVAIHISFVNSFLEEFFFRGFSFITLKEQTNRKTAYVFSSLAFSIYHIAMMIGWFAWYVIALAIIGLVVGALIFNYFDEKNENIYMSWLIHMFANFAINTIGFILFGIV